MDQKRLIELALHTLKAQKEKIELEIRALSKGVGGAIKSLRTPTPAVPTKPKRAPRSAAARKAHSERMIAYWAKRKAQAAKKPKPSRRRAKKTRPSTPPV